MDFVSNVKRLAERQFRTICVFPFSTCRPQPLRDQSFRMFSWKAVDWATVLEAANTIHEPSPRLSSGSESESGHFTIESSVKSPTKQRPTQRKSDHETPAKVEMMSNDKGQDALSTPEAKVNTAVRTSVAPETSATTRRNARQRSRARARKAKKKNMKKSLEANAANPNDAGDAIDRTRLETKAQKKAKQRMDAEETRTKGKGQSTSETKAEKKAKKQQSQKVTTKTKASKNAKANEQSQATKKGKKQKETKTDISKHGVKDANTQGGNHQPPIETKAEKKRKKQLVQSIVTNAKVNEEAKGKKANSGANLWDTSILGDTSDSKSSPSLKDAKTVQSTTKSAKSAGETAVHDRQGSTPAESEAQSQLKSTTGINADTGISSNLVGADQEADRHKQGAKQDRYEKVIGASQAVLCSQQVEVKCDEEETESLSLQDQCSSKQSCVDLDAMSTVTGTTFIQRTNLPRAVKESVQDPAQTMRSDTLATDTTGMTHQILMEEFCEIAFSDDKALLSYDNGGASDCEASLPATGETPKSLVSQENLEFRRRLFVPASDDGREEEIGRVLHMSSSSNSVANDRMEGRIPAVEEKELLSNSNLSDILKISRSPAGHVATQKTGSMVRTLQPTSRTESTETQTTNGEFGELGIPTNIQLCLPSASIDITETCDRIHRKVEEELALLQSRRRVLARELSTRSVAEESRDRDSLSHLEAIVASTVQRAKVCINRSEDDY